MQGLPKYKEHQEQEMSLPTQLVIGTVSSVYAICKYRGGSIQPAVTPAHLPQQSAGHLFFRNLLTLSSIMFIVSASLCNNLKYTNSFLRCCE